MSISSHYYKKKNNFLIGIFLNPYQLIKTLNEEERNRNCGNKPVNIFSLTGTRMYMSHWSLRISIRVFKF